MDGEFWGWAVFGTGELYARDLSFRRLLAGSFWVGSFFLGSLCSYTIKICFVSYLRLSFCIIKDLYYSSEECSNKGGSNGGSCASGFGVCCTCKLHYTKIALL